MDCAPSGFTPASFPYVIVGKAWGDVPIFGTTHGEIDRAFDRFGRYAPEWQACQLVPTMSRPEAHRVLSRLERHGITH